MDWGDVGGFDIPIPDSGFDQGDRQHILNSYSGILWSAAVVVVSPVTISMVLTVPNLSMTMSVPNITMELKA